MTAPSGSHSTGGVDPGSVQVRLAEGVATITFGHPRSNSLPGALLSRLAEAVTAAGRSVEVLVIVLRAEGSGPFCAGASFDELAAVSDAASGLRFFSGFASGILAMIRAPKFVVTRVHGKAVGGGVGLVAASDYALASEQAAVRLSELAIGIGPFVVGPVIERKIGPGAFGALAVSAEWRDARWAQAHGLYTEVHDTVVGLDQAVETRAQRLSGYSPAAMARLKQVLWEGTESWERLLLERAALSGSLVLTDPARRAIQEAIGKRP